MDRLRIATLTPAPQVVRRAIVCACVSLLLAVVLVVTLFVASAAGLELAWLVVALFIACLGALVASLAAFLKEINESLLALRLDLFEP